MVAFDSFAKTPISPADGHWLLAANPGADMARRPRAIYCAAAGSITLSDRDGVALLYDMAAGTVIPFRATRVAAIAGGTFYGLD